MNPAATYYVRIGKDVRGPFDVSQLRAMAEAAAITAESEAAPAIDGPWSLMITLPERAAIFPVKIAFGGKPRFTPTEDSQVPVTVRKAIDATVTAGPVLRTAPEHAATVFQLPERAAPLNEVQEMVRGVEAREAEFAPPPPPPPKRRLSRRFKFMLLLAVTGNLALLAIPVGYGALGDDWSMLIFRGWFLLFNAGLAIVYFALPKD